MSNKIFYHESKNTNNITVCLNAEPLLYVLEKFHHDDKDLLDHQDEDPKYSK